MIAGRYSLDREIGRGGTGPVWLATDETLQRRVAMKRIGLLPGEAQPDLARAEREARLSAQLHHPHVVQVHDVAVADDGVTHWLVMEYVEGASLSQLVKQRGALTPEQATPILSQVAQALLAAHEAGIAHRDIKPSNVLVDAGGDAKLTDFGIARLTNDPTLTRTGVVTGSPAYLAPEVAEGGPGDMRSDVWSLGATAFHLLAGRPPYEVDSNVLGTLYKIVHEDVPRLSDAGPLAPLLEGTMTKDPDQRWSMEQVVAALGGAPEPVVPVTPVVPPDPDSTQLLSAPPPPAVATASRTERPRRALPGWLWPVLGGLAVLVLVVVAVQALGNGGEDPAASSQTPTAKASPAKEDSPTAEGMADFVTEYVAKIGENPAMSWPMLTASFQRKSGGFEKYREFWEGARDGRVDNIQADPESLVVSYDVTWQGHSNGPTTRLLLAYQDGRYLIDDEITEGFEPTG